jgi:hypothetical protein
MTNTDQNVAPTVTTPTKEELAERLKTLRARADTLGIEYHPALGIVKLQMLIDEKLNDTPEDQKPAEGSIFDLPAEEAAEPKAVPEEVKEASAGVPVDMQAQISALTAQIATLQQYALEGAKTAPTVVIAQPAPNLMDPISIKQQQAEALAFATRKRKDASRLVRIHVACMNPAKTEWPGEIFTCSNSVVGSFKKFIPFDNEVGWHVPQIILNMVQERKCQIWMGAKNARGNKIKVSKMIKEFNVDILPPLTYTELMALKQRQALANSIDD